MWIGIPHNAEASPSAGHLTFGVGPTDSHDWHALHLRLAKERTCCVSPRLHPIHGPGSIVECHQLIVGPTPVYVMVVGQHTDPFARDNFRLT